jgi:hypothetical protein
MAKRKTARPASRKRTPGAARAGKSTRRTTSSTRKTATAASKNRKSAARNTGARKTGARKTAAARQKNAGRKSATRTNARTPARAAKRSTAGARSARKPASTARGSRTLVTKRQPAGRAGATRSASGRPPGSARLRQIERDRRIVEDEVPTPPSSLNLDRRPSAARSGRAEMEEKLHDHTAAGPALTAGDVDADWEAAYNTGDEAPGGDMPTPDQAVVGEIGTAIGVEYADNEELKGVDKVEERDRHRWELDPASSEDYQDRARETKKAKG